MSYAFIAMGSNQQSPYGDPKATIHAAITQLKGAEINVLVESALYVTPCFPIGFGPDFVNAVVKVETNYDATSLLRKLHQIEADFGRERLERWSERPLDLDLLAIGESVLPNAETVRSWIDLPIEIQKELAPDHLLLPHPRIQDRAFVLVPLVDIAPEWRHPILGQTATEMLAALPKEEIDAIKPVK